MSRCLTVVNQGENEQTSPVDGWLALKTLKTAAEATAAAVVKV